MQQIIRPLKNGVQRISGCRVFRDPLPHGFDYSHDIDKRFGADSIKTVFDVGANVGQSALAYLHMFPQAEIYSFEPVSSTYKQLTATAQRSPRIHVYNVGMGREPGQVTINVNPVSLISSIQQSRKEDHPEVIKLETVASFAEKQRVKTVDFLKVDTEGYDLEVLAGAASLLERQRIHFVMTECEPVNYTGRFVSFADVAAFLGRYGYRLFGVYEQQPEWDGSNCLLYWNALFICERLISSQTKLQ